MQFDNATVAFGLRMVEQVCYIEQYRRDIELMEHRTIDSEHAAKEWVAKFGSSFPAL